MVSSTGVDVPEGDFEPGVEGLEANPDAAALCMNFIVKRRDDIVFGVDAAGGAGVVFDILVVIDQGPVLSAGQQRLARIWLLDNTEIKPTALQNMRSSICANQPLMQYPRSPSFWYALEKCLRVY